MAKGKHMHTHKHRERDRQTDTDTHYFYKEMKMCKSLIANFLWQEASTLNCDPPSLVFGQDSVQK